MEDKLLKIINHYGVLPQLKYFQSEVFELNEAILDFEFSKDNFPKQHEIAKDVALKHIAEEIADVMVMLEQFKLYYDISSEEITNIFQGKVDRQLDRIKKETDNYLLEKESDK
jgi:NTP pyrophosphatase (non-canonical NTP hydrolase)